jgi:lipoprotein NlpI
MRFTLHLVASVTGLLALSWLAQADETASLLKEAQQAQSKGQLDRALHLVEQAIARDPRSAAAYRVRGDVYSALGRHAEAMADFTRVLALEPNAADVYNRRGAEQFKLGHVTESLADFDKYLALNPEAEPGHWMRGISCYYAGRFKEGRDQFAAYQKVDGNDVENAVWHFLCNARLVGAAKARAVLLPIGRDPRVPMTEVYGLFKGQAQPTAVLTAARSVRTAERKQALFLARLYLGLYFDATGDTQRALEYLGQAVTDAPVGGYMGKVARVHLARLRKDGNSRKAGGAAKRLNMA